MSTAGLTIEGNRADQTVKDEFKWTQVEVCELATSLTENGSFHLFFFRIIWHCVATRPALALSIDLSLSGTGPQSKITERR